MPSVQLDGVVWRRNVVGSEFRCCSRQSKVMTSPDVSGWHSDSSRRWLTGEGDAAVPVEGSGERPGLSHGRRIAIDKIIRKAVVAQRLCERTLRQLLRECR